MKNLGFLFLLLSGFHGGGGMLGWFFLDLVQFSRLNNRGMWSGVAKPEERETTDRSYKFCAFPLCSCKYNWTQPTHTSIKLSTPKYKDQIKYIYEPEYKELEFQLLTAIFGQIAFFFFFFPLLTLYLLILVVLHFLNLKLKLKKNIDPYC